MTPDLLKGHVDLLLLAIVRDTPPHGYEVIERLREQSGGAFDLPEGTIYPALHRLERLGFLESDWTVAEGRKRRVYRLSSTGADALRERTAEWEAMNHGVRAVLGRPLTEASR